MTIRGTIVPTSTGLIKVSELRFYSDNPRVYSLVHSDGVEPEQEEIEEELQKQDHVKDLVQDIKSHGGLIEPLLVRDGELDVLEGNSRLAAYRLLAKREPMKWGKVKCTVLPETIDDSLISALLSQLHLKGKREWPPYEQAGHIHRRHERDKVSLPDLKIETGLPLGAITKTIEAYRLMIKYKDERRERWSYYLELVKSKIIGRSRKENPGFDALIVKKIDKGEIKTAQELRDRLPIICKGSKKTLKKFVTGKATFEEAFEEAQDGGADNKNFTRLEGFRKWLAQSATQDHLVSARGPARKRVEFEVRHLSKAVASLQKKVDATM